MILCVCMCTCICACASTCMLEKLSLNTELITVFQAYYRLVQGSQVLKTSKTKHYTHNFLAFLHNCMFVCLLLNAFIVMDGRFLVMVFYSINLYQDDWIDNFVFGIKKYSFQWLHIICYSVWKKDDDNDFFSGNF